MKTSAIFSIALKNLRRHIRRTIINAVGIAVPVGVLLFFIGYYRGTYIAMMRESFIEYKSGHIQLHATSFDDRRPQDYVLPKNILPRSRNIASDIASDPSVTAVSERLVGQGFVGNGRDKMVVTIIGVDPLRELTAGVVARSTVKGKFLDGARGVLLGKKTADLFGLSVGDLCYIQAQTVHNSPNVVALPVAGIFETGFLELDKTTIFVRMHDANILFDSGDSFNKIVVYLKDMKLTRPSAAGFSARYSGFLDVKTWEYYGDALLENEKYDGMFYLIFTAILLFISVSTIMSTMYVNVFERVREIGMIRAIGWRRTEVFRLFVFESLAIGALGALAGIIIGGIPTLYLTYVGLDYADMGELLPIPMFKIIARPEYYDLILCFTVGVASAWLGAVLPSRKAARMVITDALRS